MKLPEFWDLCPADLDQLIAAWNWNFERRRDLAFTAGWTAEWVARRYARVKLPPLQSVIDELTGPSDEPGIVDPADLRKKFEVLHRLLGGTL